MEIGVGVWVRKTHDAPWQYATIVHLSGESDVKSVRYRLSTGPDARTDVTRDLSAQAVEAEETEDFLLANNSDMDLVEDLIQLPHLHEPGICHTLNARFKLNEIYTLTGEILLAINPFKNIGIYSDKIIRKYIRNGDKRSLGHDVQPLPPHVFGTADQAYRALIRPLVSTECHNQSILVSGESGAGKTESTKFIMQYLGVIAQQHKKAASDDATVMKQVLSSNPILEAFGNARTIRNDNSSRFGKFIKMQFNDAGALVGAAINTYLLEKIRLTYQAEDERNYHVFYEMLAGASDVEKERWQLLKPQMYHYLNQSSCSKRHDGVDDAEQFRVLKNAMQVMGFQEEDVESVFQTVSALLHLGNVEFEEVHHASGTEGSEITGDSTSLAYTQSFFEVDADGLQQTLCFRRIQAKDEEYSINLLPAAAESTRDALARYVYGRLFDWLVSRINDMIEKDVETSGFVGLLDIFGFEDLEQNSFEQLCINYANETLQQHFNRTVLRLEQEVYEEEEITWSFINFPDNTQCIDLIQKKPLGVLSVLDEECIIPQGNDKNFCRKLYKHHASHPHFAADKTQQASHQFVIKHYAGDVLYDSFGFCDKNKDTLFYEITELLQRSSKAFVRNLLPRPKRQKRGEKKEASKTSIGGQFRTQLQELLSTIGQTHCHYVRTLKPNDDAKAATFDSKRVCDQLKAGGVLEAVRVNRAGYPVRMSHQQFIKRYRPLADASYLGRIPEAAAEEGRMEEEEVKGAASLLVTFLLQAHAQRYPELAEDQVASIQVGRTRVFFRRAAIQFVEAQLAKRYGEFVVLIQANVRRLLARRSFVRLNESTRTAQRVVRGFLGRRAFARQLATNKKLRRKREEQRRRQEEEERQRAAEEERQEERRRAAEEERQEEERRREEERLAAKLVEEEKQRLTAQTARSSDPASDDSGEDKDTRRRSSGRSTQRFRFTREYDGGRSSLDEGMRSVAMEPGDTVLHVAANCCNEQDVLKLLQNGSDIDARNRRERTPLHTATLHDNIEVVGILLDWEADVVVQDEDGNTPLHLTKDAHIARMLLEAGCTPNIVNGDGRTPLIEAVEKGHAGIVKELLHFKADVLFRELKHHQTALHLAVRRGHYAIVTDLCAAEDVQHLINLTDRNGNTALHFAVARDRKNGYRLVDYLLRHGSDVDRVNARFQTPLVVHIMTTRQTDPAIAELMLSKGADPNISLTDGATLLHIALERELIDVGCALIKHGALLNKPDTDNRLPVDLVEKKYLKKLYAAISTPPAWVEEKSRRRCMVCNGNFKFGTRRHHCRHCGRVCCSDCSNYSVELFRFPKDFPGRVTDGGKNVKDAQRVCRTCHAVFKLRAAQKESKSGFMARVLGYEWDEITDK